MNYAEFTHNLYVSNIFPIITNLNQNKTYSCLRDSQTYYCSPDERGARGVRLYPSALMMLTYFCINPERETSQSLLDVAAGMELFHNYSLAHDDVFDNHDIRRNRDTIVKQLGLNESVMVGNNMVGDCLQLFSKAETPQLQNLIHYFGKAVCDLNVGQRMDEKSFWEKVAENELLDYWWLTASMKLAVGIFAVEAAAIMQNREDLIAPWHEFEEKISLISQIMNDTGDVFNFAGFYSTEHSNRKTMEEAAIKYTYPLIWLGKKENIPVKTLQLEPLTLKKKLLATNYLDAADAEIDKLRNRVKEIVLNMGLPRSDYLDILNDYINAPRIPRERINYDC